jgi:hypothetical protein
MDNSLIILLELQAAKGESIMGIRPILLNFDGMLEPSESFGILSKLFVSTSKVKDGGFMIFVELQGLFVTI